MQGGGWKREKFTLAVPSLSVSGQLLIPQEPWHPFFLPFLSFLRYNKGYD